MYNNRFIAIGHIVDDIAPFPHVGGGVVYSCVTALKLGKEAHIITKCAKNHPYIHELETMGIIIHVLPSKIDTITTFKNIYDQKGKRIQYISQMQEKITKDDLPYFPHEILSNSTILIAEIIGEVDESLFPEITKSSELAVAAQGYFRKINKSGLVTPKKWITDAAYLKAASLLIFSKEDIGIAQDDNTSSLFNEVIGKSDKVALTNGASGVSIFERGKLLINTDAFLLNEVEEKDFTGAGDVFASVFLIEKAKGEGIKEASVSACFYAACKIMELTHSEGIKSIPSIQSIQEFIRNNPQRVAKYLKKEQLSELSLLDNF